MTIPATAHRKSTSVAMVSEMGCKWIVAPVHWASGLLYRWSEMVNHHGQLAKNVKAIIKGLRSISLFLKTDNVWQSKSTRMSTPAIPRHTTAHILILRE